MHLASGDALVGFRRYTINPFHCHRIADGRTVKRSSSSGKYGIIAMSQSFIARNLKCKRIRETIYACSFISKAIKWKRARTASATTFDFASHFVAAALHQRRTLTFTHTRLRLSSVGSDCHREFVYFFSLSDSVSFSSNSKTRHRRHRRQLMAFHSPRSPHE